MIRPKYISSIVIVILLFTACEKDEDITTKKTISGNIMNMCTGKGFADVEVKFVTDQKKGNFIKSAYYESWVSTMSDSAGNFKFSDVDIHSSDKFKYGIVIENKGDYLAEQYGHSGISYALEKNELSEFQKIRLSAPFKNCIIYLPQETYIISPDKFTITLEQRIFHSYEPEGVYKLIWSSDISPPPNNYKNFGGHNMGWWHITLDKTKNGLHSVIEDSIYLDMGDTAHYNIPW